jgi:MOSC domain-containing protein YiiM
MDQARVVAVSSSGEYTFTKPNRESITLVAGLGVDGDIHSGVTVKHRSRVARDPSQPNLRQVHLMHNELHDELRAKGYAVEAGQLGENVTTAGLDLLGLPTGTVLRLGDEAVIQVTGLRNPCLQIENFSTGMLGEVVGRDDAGEIVRRAGIMSIVLTGGVVRPGDPIAVELPDAPRQPLQPV